MDACMDVYALDALRLTPLSLPSASLLPPQVLQGALQEVQEQPRMASPRRQRNCCRQLPSSRTHCEEQVPKVDRYGGKTACHHKTAAAASNQLFPPQSFAGALRKGQQTQYVIVNASRCPPRPVRFWLALRYTLCLVCLEVLCLFESVSRRRNA